MAYNTTRPLALGLPVQPDYFAPHTTAVHIYNILPLNVCIINSLPRAELISVKSMNTHYTIIFFPLFLYFLPLCSRCLMCWAFPDFNLACISGGNSSSLSSTLLDRWVPANTTFCACDDRLTVIWIALQMCLHHKHSAYLYDVNIVINHDFSANNLLRSLFSSVAVIILYYHSRYLVCSEYPL